MKIKVRGIIVQNDEQWIYEWFNMESTSPKNIEEQLNAANDEDIEIEIDSPGGDVLAGSAIYTMLKEYAGNVVVKIVSWAASAASVIAMAGKKVLISPTAQIMIHNVFSRSAGDYRDHEHEAEILKGWNKSLANAYQLKTGMSQDELLRFMNKETWLTAQDAVKYKFADEIMFDENLQLAAAPKGTLLPPEVINKVRNLIKSSNGQLTLEAALNMPVNQELQQEASRQVPVDLYKLLLKDLERRADLC